MKKLNLSLLMLVAIAVTASTLSFKMAQDTSMSEQKWFEYTNETGDGDVENPANFALTPNDGELPPVCPIGTAELCAIKALPQTQNLEQPNLSTIVADKFRSER